MGQTIDSSIINDVVEKTVIVAEQAKTEATKTISVSQTEINTLKSNLYKEIASLNEKINTIAKSIESVQSNNNSNFINAEIQINRAIQIANNSVSTVHDKIIELENVNKKNNTSVIGKTIKAIKNSTGKIKEVTL